MGHCASKIQCPGGCACSEIVKREMGVPGLKPDLSRAMGVVGVVGSTQNAAEAVRSQRGEAEGPMREDA